MVLLTLAMQHLPSWPGQFVVTFLVAFLVLGQVVVPQDQGPCEQLGLSNQDDSQWQCHPWNWKLDKCSLHVGML